MRRIVWGVVGWLAAVLPLLGVNIAGYASILDTGTAVIAGAIALLGGILLGGVVTGLLAGRPSAERAGGATAALPTGGIAAALYVISLIAVVEVAIHTQAAPAIVAEHPIRIAGAIICLGAILLSVSLVVGMLAGRLSPPASAQPAQRSAAPVARQAQPQPRYGPNSGAAARGYPQRGDYHGQYEQGDRRSYGDTRDNVGQGRSHSDYNNDYSGYRGYDQRQSAPQRSGTPSRPQTRAPSGPSGPSGPASSSGSSARYGGRQGSGRDEDWRETRR